VTDTDVLGDPLIDVTDVADADEDNDAEELAGDPVDFDLGGE
jgi:hypothetical protein